MDKLAQYKTELLVSLDRAKKETHEFIRGNNTFYITLEQVKKLRNLNVNDFSESCRKCAVKYYCAGACRGEAYFKNKCFKSKCPYCEDMKELIITMMFRLSEGNNEIFSAKIKQMQEQFNRHHVRSSAEML